MGNLFTELSLVLIGAGVIAYIMHFLKQPSIIAYIITGLIVGPLGVLNLQHGEILQGLSDIGITLLLFMVGLDLDISQLKRIGKAAVFAGIGQIIATVLIGYGIVRILGFDSGASWFAAIALTFSSTIIVVKLLSEKHDLQSLYGKLAIGILLIQDVAAIFVLIFVSTITGGDSNPYHHLGMMDQTIITVAKIFMAAIAVVMLSKYVFPRLIKTIEKTDELVLLFALAWSLGLAAFFTWPIVGFNAAIGGFVAGLALANSGVHYQISSTIKPIRDFFIIIFFIVLGSHLVLNDISTAIIPAIVLSLFVLIVKPFIIMAILSILGYKPRVTFMAGTTLGQISEFSLILIAIALTTNNINNTMVTIVTLVAIITISLSSYGIFFADRLFKFLHPILKHFDRHISTNESALEEKQMQNHIVLVGAHRLGSHMLDLLKMDKKDLLILDFNPDVVHRFEQEGYTAICGDVSDPFIQDLANLRKANMIISTAPDLTDNLAILEFVKRNHKRIKLIVNAHDEDDAKKLYKLGADYVLLQHFVGGTHLADIIDANHTLKSLETIKKRHLRSLEKHNHFR
jgi:Kef-type K+ transport system membrane component KefB